MTPEARLDIVSELRRVVEALRVVRTSVPIEARLHELVADAMTAAGIAHQHEVTLGEHGRIDFITTGGIGIEVKIAGARTDVLRQLHGYAKAESVLALVLFTTRATHALHVESLNGKPFVTVRSHRWV